MSFYLSTFYLSSKLVGLSSLIFKVGEKFVTVYTKIIRYEVLVYEKMSIRQQVFDGQKQY